MYLLLYLHLVSISVSNAEKVSWVIFRIILQSLLLSVIILLLQSLIFSFIILSFIFQTCFFYLSLLSFLSFYLNFQPSFSHCESSVVLSQYSFFYFIFIFLVSLSSFSSLLCLFVSLQSYLSLLSFFFMFHFFSLCSAFSRSVLPCSVLSHLQLFSASPSLFLSSASVS